MKQLDADVDFLAWQLRPAALSDLGLAAALGNYVRQFSERFGISAEFHAGDMKGAVIDPLIEAHLYRIAQEALNNCAKHSRCMRANVLLERRDRHAVLIVEDDGDGFDAGQERPNGVHLGLVGMQERVAIVGGTLEVETAPKKGTTIFVRVPVGMLGSLL